MEKETKQAVVNTVFGSVFGNVEQKYMKEEAGQAVESCTKSPVRLVQKPGNRIDLIRVVNAIYELGMVEHVNGGKLTKKDFFAVVGQTFNVDLTNYFKDLSNSMNSSVAYEKQTQIFDEMKRKTQEIFNSK